MYTYIYYICIWIIVYIALFLYCVVWRSTNFHSVVRPWITHTKKEVLVLCISVQEGRNCSRISLVESEISSWHYETWVKPKYRSLTCLCNLVTETLGWQWAGSLLCLSIIVVDSNLPSCLCVNEQTPEAAPSSKAASVYLTPTTTISLWRFKCHLFKWFVCYIKNNRRCSVLWRGLKHPALWLIIFIHRFSFICALLLFYPWTICCIVGLWEKVLWLSKPVCVSVSMGRVYWLAPLRCQWA